MTTATPNYKAIFAANAMSVCQLIEQESGFWNPCFIEPFQLV
jgi:hypothetical protein